MASHVPRLKRRPEFLRVAATRRKWVAPGLILQVRRHSVPDTSSLKPSDIRVGFTVSRKVGNAVARNRARRRLREVADQVLSQCAIAGHDFVIIGRKNTLTRPFDDLIKDLKWSLKRLDLYEKVGTAGKAAEIKD